MMVAAHEGDLAAAQAAAISRQGIRAVIIEGKAPENALYHLMIDADGKAFLRDAPEYRGMRNYELAGRLLGKYGENADDMVDSIIRRFI